MKIPVITPFTLLTSFSESQKGLANAVVEHRMHYDRASGMKLYACMYVGLVGLSIDYRILDTKGQLHIFDIFTSAVDEYNKLLTEFYTTYHGNNQIK